MGGRAKGLPAGDRSRWATSPRASTPRASSSSSSVAHMAAAVPCRYCTLWTLHLADNAPYRLRALEPGTLWTRWLMEPAVYGPGGLQNRQLTDLEAYGPVGLQAEPLIATRAAGHGGLRTPLRPARRLSAAAYSQGCLKPLGLGGLQPIAGGPQPGRGGSAGAAPPPI